MSSSLHNHSMYSLQDGFGTPDEMLNRANKIGLKALAITEHGNSYSWVYFDKIKNNYPNVKVIYGVELYECFDINIQDKDNKYFHLIALAKNEDGRKSLNEIITRSEFEGKYYKPRVDLKMLKPHAKNLIISTACLASKIAREHDYKKCVDYINEYKSIFPHFYLEMQSHRHVDQEIYNQKILQLSKDTNTPFIITTDSHASVKEHLKYQARHVQIARDADTMSESYEGCYIQSDEEIHDIMDNQIGKENVDTGLKNTDIIADMIEIVNMPFQEPQLPTFPLPKGFDNNKDYLKHLVEKGFVWRNIDKMSDIEQKKRIERYEYELNVIDTMGFNGYFLIVWDYVNFCRNNNIEVGVGRGSAAGSMVCYLLGISALDPIEHNLIFERFLNPERISFPDIDNDFADKEKIIEYLKNKYGKLNVCQVLNINEITPLIAIKDVGRVIKDENGKPKLSSVVVNNISKLFTEKTFDECIKLNENAISKYEGEVYEELFDVARMLSNRVRHISTHAGGVGIVNTIMYDYMPMTLTDKGEQVIQVDKVVIEEIGIIKFDILGLNTLNIIGGVKKSVGLTDWDLDPNNKNFINDAKMYELLQSGKTNNVFQVESQGMKELLVRLKPTSLEDVSAVLALYRPDSMNYLEDYIYYKNNKDIEIKYIHEDMKPILKKTYGQMIYQESLMEIVRKFGGRTYGGADKFRKGIGKKDIKLVQKEADDLYSEIVLNGYDEKIAKLISDDLREKGGYMFNKSHSASYAVITLQTAYLKAHYPVEFYCEVLNANIKDNGKLNKYMVEAQELGIKILPPHINNSDFKFDVHNNSILFGLNSINGIGEKVVENIISERENNGKFAGLDNFLSRTSCNSAQVVKLIKSGAIPTKDKYNMLLRYSERLYGTENLEYKPYQDVKSLPTLLQLKTEWNIDTDVIKSKEKRLRLYNEKRKIEHKTTKYEEWILNKEKKKQSNIEEFKEKYMDNQNFWEFEALTIFLSDNPFKDFVKYNDTDFYESEEGDDCIIIGIISKIQKKKDRNKKDYAFINVYESNGLLEGIAWSSVYSKFLHLIKKGNKLAFYAEKSKEDSFIIKKIKTIEEWIEDRQLQDVVKL